MASSQALRGSNFIIPNSEDSQNNSATKAGSQTQQRHLKLQEPLRNSNTRVTPLNRTPSIVATKKSSRKLGLAVLFLCMAVGVGIAAYVEGDLDAVITQLTAFAGTLLN